jgi:hypothetical protein
MCTGWFYYTGEEHCDCDDHPSDDDWEFGPDAFRGLSE